ncbi:hypothetical protein LPY66_09780 [Dehalobacter sp. DCM]|uniref:NADH-ubiquinone oxidoreductase-F iron-sulfur binding region domain-containing protein n=1 Tax=Dehalobacter sp. DCM TaxID=2907827 RepID=UPI003081F8F1|nr:hypothetical protein LPY66_09780 [Dehalobacter sp. DCM]
MNETQLRVRAESACSDLLDSQSIRIRVSALSGNTAAEACFRVFKEYAAKDNGGIGVIRTGSTGFYDLEPIIMIDKPGNPTVCYANITEDAALLLIQSYLENGDPRADLALGTTAVDGFIGIPSASSLPLFKRQKRVVLNRCGQVDPESISHYIAGYGGYTGLAKALTMTPADIIKLMAQTGLRERFGHGCPLMTQWHVFREAEGSAKVVICNALDNDLQARTARILLEGDPHAVLEGLLIAAYTVGAAQAIMAIPAGYNTLVKTLNKVLADMKEYNLIGTDILGSGFSCDIIIKEIPVSTTACEKTALIRFLEGRQAIPFLRTSDNNKPMLGDKPAMINQIETLANVSAVLQVGAEVLEGIGTEESVGTKIVTLTGDVDHSYTVEVPFGTPLETVIREIGGGIINDAKIKAVQYGGPTSVYLSADDLAKTVSYETTQEVGALMGFSLIDVVADNVCAVEMTQKQMAFLHSQTCGKCVYCREGTLHLSHMLDDIAKAEGTAKDLDLLREIGGRMRTGCVCSFGTTAANPVLSSLQLFPAEYDAHIKQKKCPYAQGGKEA